MQLWIPCACLCRLSSGREGRSNHCQHVLSRETEGGVSVRWGGENASIFLGRLICLRKTGEERIPAYLVVRKSVLSSIAIMSNLQQTASQHRSPAFIGALEYMFSTKLTTCHCITDCTFMFNLEVRQNIVVKTIVLVINFVQSHNNRRHALYTGVPKTGKTLTKYWK